MDTEPFLPPVITTAPISRSVLVGLVGAVFFICIAAAAAFNFPAPSGFVPDTIVHVDSDASLSSVGKLLKNEHIIRSTTLFRIIVTILGGEHSISAGDYYFQVPSTVWTVASRLVIGNEGLASMKITFPEGTSVRGMSEILSKNIAAESMDNFAGAFSFDAAGFLTLASTSEGYLFPDTYFFTPDVAPASVIMAMKGTFNEEVDPLLPAIAASGHSLNDIVIMASILEKEALSDADRRIVAGILWKRIDSGYPLQIDAPFAYAIGKTSDQLTLADLQVDSPYNTYKYKGLPPTAINNPGLGALTDAVNASTTKYWYYLSDSKGVMHYAVTYAQHLANKAEYLDK